MERVKLVSGHLVAPHGMVQDHVILITGAAQGIGREAAIQLARNGAKIAINDVDATKANATVQELVDAGYEAMAITGDLLDENVPGQLIQKVLDKWGKVNCLVNNAGFCFDAAIHKMEEAKFDIIMKIHNYVPYRLVKALSGHWMDPKNANMPKSIVNVSSTSGLHGAMGQINYSTAKAGILGLTKTVAAEWGRYNVRCNAVAYGWIDTRITRPPTAETTLQLGSQTIAPGIPENAKKWRDTSDIPLGRMGTPEEAASVILFLASPMANYISGTCIECTGGRFM
ncbi:hypothetical protein MBLNU459_g3827t1 [Dothideomycetes sp. NU459]